jgi:hypothetical protein
MRTIITLFPNRKTAYFHFVVEKPLGTIKLPIKKVSSNIPRTIGIPLGQIIREKNELLKSLREGHNHE